MKKERAFELEMRRELERQGWTVHRIDAGGYPDLLAVKPDAPPLYIEIKRSSKKYGLSGSQKLRMEILGGKGFRVAVWDAAAQKLEEVES